MDAQAASYFADIVAQASATFEQVEYSTDTTPERSILRLQADYGSGRVSVVELFSDGLRKYRYYLLRGDWVVAGFDNSPDPRAIRLKYDKIGAQHAGELVPHLHLRDKADLVLTDEVTFAFFVEWLQTNHPLDDSPALDRGHGPADRPVGM